MEHKSLLESLRQVMKNKLLDYYWVPSDDSHFNEYVPACWQRRAAVSGFTGSAGDLLVGLDHAWLWTDSRYFEQAEMQLDDRDFTLQRIGIDDGIFAFLAKHAADKKVGWDAQVVSVKKALKWSKCAADFSFYAIAMDENLVDSVWQERPVAPPSVINWHDLCYVGKSADDKLSQVRALLKAENCTHCLLSDLTNIAWLTNLRGQAVATTPVFIAYMVVGLSSATLYVNASDLTGLAESKCRESGIDIKSYFEIDDDLPLIKGKVWLDPNTTSEWSRLRMIQSELYLQQSPVSLLQACKNVIEQQGMREAHRLDGIAMVKFLAWADENWQGLNEVTLADRLFFCRQQQPGFRGLSFETICGYADHGAIVHYSASDELAYDIGDDNGLLLDSGGQYDCGTTDITRMLHFGKPTTEYCFHYTLVLKGHIALAQAVFPKGTCGETLDPLARSPLQAEGLDYGHGTGHGVGCYLAVHEGPQRISPLESGVALKPGMVLSNEPGVYFPGEYGIRIENLLLVREVARSSGGAEVMYYFETLTQVPYARHLINLDMLDEKEIQWVDEYHQGILGLLKEGLDSKEKNWLREATLPLLS
jgi:Xaa-Pro aminopeptidase